MDFNTIPICNTYGTVIGLVPKHFIIVLIENHMWYEQNRMTRAKTLISEAYKSARDRNSSTPNSPNAIGDKLMLNRINPSGEVSNTSKILKSHDDSDESIDLDAEESKRREFNKSVQGDDD
jgi:hypothetical protein